MPKSKTSKKIKLGHQLTENVKLLQKAVLIHKSRFLIVKKEKNSNSRPGFWDLPGGNCEWPSCVDVSGDHSVENQNQENMHQKDIAREVLEETGLIVFDQHFTKENMTFFRTFFEAEKQIYSIITGWKVEMPSDFDRSQVVLSNEHTDHKWITFDELNEYDFGGKKGEFVKDIIRESM